MITTACVISIKLCAINPSNFSISSNNAAFNSPDVLLLKNPKLTFDKYSRASIFKRCIILYAATWVNIIVIDINIFCRIVENIITKAHGNTDLKSIWLLIKAAIILYKTTYGTNDNKPQIKPKNIPIAILNFS